MTICDREKAFLMDKQGLTHLPRSYKLLKKRLIGIDLFCGCGGASLGMVDAGIEMVAGVDNSFDALLTYFYNLGSDTCKWVGKEPSEAWKKRHGFGEMVGHNQRISWRPIRVVICQDINMLTGWQILKYAGVDHVDVIWGSPPCVSFSPLSRKTRHYAPEDELCFEMARIIHELRPKFWVMENVPYFAKKRLPDGRLIMNVFHQIVNFGYEAKLDHSWQFPQLPIQRANHRLNRNRGGN